MQYIALGHSTSVRIISSSSYATLALILNTGTPTSLSFTHDNAYLIVTSAVASDPLRIYETTNFTRLSVLPGYSTKRVWYAAVSPTEPYIVVGVSDYYYPGPGADNMKLEFISTETWEIISTHTIYNSDDRTLSLLTFSPDGTRLGINTSYSPYVGMLLDPTTKTTIFTPSVSGYTGASFNPDSTKWYVLYYQAGGYINGVPAFYQLREHSAIEWSNPTIRLYQETAISGIYFTEYLAECIIRRAMPNAAENLLVFSTANWACLNKGPSQLGITSATDVKYYDRGRKAIVIRSTSPYQVTFDAIDWAIEHETEYSIATTIAISGQLDFPISTAIDSISFTPVQDIAASVICRPNPRLHLRPQPVPTCVTSSSVQDGTAFSDWIARVVILLAESDFSLSTDSSRAIEAICILAELARVQDRGVGTRATIRLLAEQLLAHEVISFVHALSADEVIELADTLSVALEALLTSEESISIASRIVSSLTILLTEEVVCSSVVASTIVALLQARERIAFIGKLVLAEGSFSAWVMNAETTGTTSYSNFPFNSLFTHRGKTYGVVEDGLYELTGDTDDGDPIEAYLRTGDIDFGTAREKNIPRAYLYLLTGGKMILKTISSARGVRTERLYEMAAKGGNEEALRRVPLARGLRGVTWAFEVRNVAGSDFDFSGAEVLPVVLSLRGS